VFYVGRTGYPAAIQFHGYVPIGCRSRR
jgi:hypothetical protein